MRFRWTVALLVAACTPGFATYTVTENNTAAQLAQAIVGDGVTLTGTPTLTGIDGQAGTFVDFTTGSYTNPITGGTGNVAIPSGVILSTGHVKDAQGNYENPGASLPLGGSSNANLSTLAGGRPTFDAVMLTFSFIPNASHIFIQYLFASTEYPNYVNSQYNDVFAFYVNGSNVALVPGTTDPVTINNINVGKPTGVNASNPAYFTQYSTSGTPFNYGGATTLLTATANVNAGEVNTFSFAIADAGDSILDSAVLIGAGKFTTHDPSAVPEPASMGLMAAGIGALVWMRRRGKP